MNYLVQWGRDPWGEDILTHAQWNLVYVALALGVCFMVAHTLFVRFWPKPAGPATRADGSRRPPRECRRG